MRYIMGVIYLVVMLGLVFLLGLLTYVIVN